VTEGRFVCGTAFLLNHSRPKRRAEGDPAVKKLIIGFAILVFAVATANAGPESVGRPLKLVLERHSTVPAVEVMKNLSDHCPNVTITTNPHNSNFMLSAGGWPGEYRFMVIAKGGDAIYATKTVLLSNAVKDVCKFLNSQP
jgi:hypothetical protein